MSRDVTAPAQFVKKSSVTFDVIRERKINRQVRPRFIVGPFVTKIAHFTRRMSVWKYDFDTKKHFCAMFFRGLTYTKFGLVALHGNVKNKSEFSFFRRNLTIFGDFFATSTLNEARKKKTFLGQIYFCHITMKNNQAKVCFPTLKKPHVSLVAVTSSTIQINVLSTVLEVFRR